MDQGATAWIRRCSISARGIASGSQTSVLISTPEKRWWSSRTTSNRWPSCSRLIRAPGLGDSARRNAIFAAYAHGKLLVGATMYGTLFPCADCARAIVAAGLSRLVVIGVPKDPVRDERWLEHYYHSERIL